MLVHLGRIGDPRVDAPVDSFHELATRDAIGRHSVTRDAAAADLVLFPQCHMLGLDWRLTAIRRSEVFRANIGKVVVYDERDRPWPAAPGVYVSMPSHGFQHDRQRAGGYYLVPDVDPSDRAAESDLLFSFVGSATARAREPLFRLRHAEAVVERVTGFAFFDPASEDFDARRARYRSLVLRSQFVLCPRGTGTSSIRLYEVMATGRVPVIISDEWVPPQGPDWEALSIRWPEGTTDGLVELLERRAGEAAGMGRRAREAYEEFFAADRAFDRIVDLCSEVRRSRPGLVGQASSGRSVASAAGHSWSRKVRHRIAGLRRRIS